MRNVLTVCAALFLLAQSAIVRPASAEAYFEVGIGASRPAADATEPLDPDNGLAFALAAGRHPSRYLRVEMEVSRGQIKASLPNEPLEVDAVYTALGTNILTDFGSLEGLGLGMEIGVGVGWAFADDPCVSWTNQRGVNEEVCGVSGDDYMLQAIAGIAYRITPKNTVVARYRMVHIGGLSGEDRGHAFTIGYRRHF